MPDTNSPEEPVNTVPPTQPTPPQQVDWEARYKGAVPKIEQLTLSKRELEAKLEQMSSQLEQLNAQLGQRDVEKDVAVGEWQKKYTQTLEEKQQSEAELAQLRAMKAKMDTAKELGLTNLMPVIDHIPYSGDPEVLKTIMKDFANWGQGMVKEREAQLLTGVTPPTVPVDNTPPAPATHEAWKELVSSLPFGSKEREQAMQRWFQFGQSN